MKHSQRRNSVLAGLGLVTVLFGGACGEGDGATRVHSVEPRHGHLTGQQPVSIGGKNFRTDIGYTVYFGTQAASRVMVQSPETLVAIAPGASEAGAVDLTIRGDDGTAVRIKGGYNYDDMGGNVVEQFGDQPARREGGNLAY
ncbi:MAG: IPT/TIG domain-containing protein [Polyangiaceae bacterium]|nr:IPT/TIG domain-containing protein [Polyangiaceae bacterium]